VAAVPGDVSPTPWKKRRKKKRVTVQMFEPVPVVMAYVRIKSQEMCEDYLEVWNMYDQ
jgi:hypothetical protein